IVDAPQLALASADVTNFDPATGGADRETIEHAVKNAPAVFRSLKRAVTTADYEALALNFNGVGKVRAEAGNFNTVNLFVAPAGGGNVSDLFEANLLAYFEDKRPASTILEIRDVDYVAVYVTAEIGVGSYYSQEEISGKVKDAGRDLLAFDNVNFAKTIYLSKFFEAIEAIEGVEFVNIAEFRREGKLPNNGQPPEDFESSGKILFESNEIPKIPGEPAYADGIRVLLEGEF
ncbi:MAG: baseplate J/gp47 family protein, partial [Calditrichaeota bacterium]|nr:baseplate J/gp47 family protein [Calditrichota bacterium]